MPTVTVRIALPTDADALAPLLAALGYPASPDAFAARLERMAVFGSAVALVATVADDVVGLATAHAFPTVHADAPAVWLTTFVVAPTARRRGVGARLVQAVEAWAAAQGALRVSVTSGTHRGGAHVFYAGLGYDLTGHRFTRVLPNDSAAPTASHR